MINTTINQTFQETSESEDVEPQYIIISKIVAYAVVLVTSLVGNVMIIVCYIKTRTGPQHLQRTINDCLILSLSCSDILLPIFAVPERITRIYTNESWMISGAFGVVVCKLVNFNEAVSIVASLLTLNVIAIDRFAAIVFPLKRSFTKRGITWVILGIWLVAVAYNSPLLYYSFPVQEKNKLACTARRSLWDVNSWRGFYLGLSSLSLLVILCSYVAIAVKMAKRKKLLRKMSINTAQREISSSKVLKTSSAIILAFYLCYFCYWLKALVCLPENPPGFCPDRAFKFLSVFFVMLNSALNPLIYFFFSSRYRKGLSYLVSQSTKKHASTVNTRV